VITLGRKQIWRIYSELSQREKFDTKSAWRSDPCNRQGNFPVGERNRLPGYQASQTAGGGTWPFRRRTDAMPKNKAGTDRCGQTNKKGTVVVPIPQGMGGGVFFDIFAAAGNEGKPAVEWPDILDEPHKQAAICTNGCCIPICVLSGGRQWKNLILL